MSTPGSSRPGDAKSSRIAYFGQFEFHERAGELLRRGLKVKVQDQPLRVLLYLLENAGEIVTRDELRSHLWPDGTFVDFEHSLNTAIKKLRQVLGDDAENARFIETLPRRGYRFIAPVEWSDGTTPGIARPKVVEIPAAGHDRRSRSSYKTLGIAVGLLALLAVATLLWRTGSAPTAPARSMSVTPLTTYPGNEEFGVLSPDGERLLFSWDENSTTSSHIYVKQLGTEEPLQLTKGKQFDFAPIWSPDGRYIAFMRGDNFMSPESMASLFVVPALGGAERQLTTVHVLSRLGPQQCPNIAWSPDGKTLAFSDRTAPGNNFGIFLLSLDTLERKQFTSAPETALGDSYPSFSPDGKTLAFIRTTKESADVFTVPVSGGTPTQITNEKHITLLGLAWTEDGKEIVYGGFGMWAVPAKGGASRTILPVRFASSISIHGNKLVFSQHEYEENIWKVGLAGAQARELPTKAFESTRADEGPRYSPDGKRVAFQSTRSGNYEIWVSDADGSRPLQLTKYEGPLTGSPRWSPDGQRIIYDSRPNGNADIFVINANGGNPQQLTTDRSDEVMPSYSRDGRWIYFASDRGGSWNVWKMPSIGGPATQVTKLGGFTPIESSDGKYIYYAKSFSDCGIWRVPVQGGAEEAVIDDLPPGMYGYWTLMKDGIYYVAAEYSASVDMPNMAPPVAILNFYSFSTRKKSKLISLQGSPFTGAPGLEITPDRKHALVVMAQGHGSDLEMVENFR